MAQLDFHLIYDLASSIIFAFLWNYYATISNIILIVSLILRIRKLNLYSDRIFIYMLLKESLNKTRLKFYVYLLKLNFNQMKFIKIKFKKLNSGKNRIW